VKIVREGGKGSPHWEQGWKLLTDLQHEAVQLDLLASRPVCEAAALKAVNQASTDMGDAIKAHRAG
jgi:hypothetical protein